MMKRTIIGVSLTLVASMLTWLTPGLAQATSHTTHHAASSHHWVTYKGTMTKATVLPRGAASPQGNGRSYGNCGTSYLSTSNGNRFFLILQSSQGVIGTGSYEAVTNGFGSLAFYGGISGSDQTVWASGWKSIFDAGLWPNTITVSGWVTTAFAGFCFFIVAAPAY